MYQFELRGIIWLNILYYVISIWESGESGVRKVVAVSSDEMN